MTQLILSLAGQKGVRTCNLPCASSVGSSVAASVGGSVVGGASSSWIVTVISPGTPMAVVIEGTGIPPFSNLRVNVSSCSCWSSSIMAISTLVIISPIGKMTVLENAT